MLPFISTTPENWRYLGLSQIRDKANWMRLTKLVFCTLHKIDGETRCSCLCSSSRVDYGKGEAETEAKAEISLIKHHRTKWNTLSISHSLHKPPTGLGLPPYCAHVENQRATDCWRAYDIRCSFIREKVDFMSLPSNNARWNGMVESTTSSHLMHRDIMSLEINSPTHEPTTVIFWAGTCSG